MEPSAPSRFELFLRHRFWFGLLLLIALLGLGSYGGLRAYRQSRSPLLAAQAVAALEAEDFAGASLAAKGALKLDPTNLQATEVIAELSDKAGSSTALSWRRRLLQLEPGSFQRRMDLANSALRFEELELAAKTLGDVQGESRLRPEFHEVAGRLALATGDTERARKELQAALAQEPDNSLYRFLHTLSLLDADSAESARERRDTLSELSSNPRFAVSAKRALIMDAMRTGNPDAALERARELQSRPDARFEDRLLYLALLESASSPEFERALASLQSGVLTNPPQFASLLSWMVDNGLASEALEWADTANADMLRHMPAGLAVAMALAHVEDWDRLAGLLRQSDWQTANFMRFALLARALREKGGAEGWRSVWNQSVSQAGRLPGASRQLFDLVDRWGWELEAREVLWEMARGVADAPWALGRLHRHFRQAGDTKGLRATAERMLELDPGNRVVRNNLAMFSMLLGVDEANAHTTAKELYLAEPANPYYISTYAFSLLRQDRPGEALGTLNTLDGPSFKNPDFALYYGVALARSGAHTLAVEFLRRAATAALLPEEQQLLEKTLAELEKRHARPG